MAQREEETELKVPGSVTPCANNCGRPGSPATKNMCRSCFQAALPLNSTPCSAPDKRRSSPICPQASAGAASGSSTGDAKDGGGDARTAAADSAPSVPPAARTVNRCSGCRRKVGLAGFRCRCGDLFCAQHRYSDRHDCSFDYKAAGGETIERDNPVVKAAKIIKI